MLKAGIAKPAREIPQKALWLPFCCPLQCVPLPHLTMLPRTRPPLHLYRFINLGGKSGKQNLTATPVNQICLTFLPLSVLTECCFPSAPVLSVQGDKLLGQFLPSLTCGTIRTIYYLCTYPHTYIYIKLYVLLYCM